MLAARGQTMSIAFYPQLGCVLYGSEASATKAGLSIDAKDLDRPLKEGEGGGSAARRKGKSGARVRPANEASDSSPSWRRTRKAFLSSLGLEEGFRFDLDDVSGEVVLLRWGERTPHRPPMVVSDGNSAARRQRRMMPMTEVMTYGSSDAPQASR